MHGYIRMHTPLGGEIKFFFGRGYPQSLFIQFPLITPVFYHSIPLLLMLSQRKAGPKAPQQRNTRRDTNQNAPCNRLQESVYMHLQTPYCYNHSDISRLPTAIAIVVNC